MRIAELDILIVPTSRRLDADHWQARWARNMKTAQLVDVVSSDAGLERTTMDAIVEAVARSKRPAVLVAHAAAIDAVAHVAPHLALDKIAGAFLVGPLSRAVVSRDHRIGPAPIVPLGLRSALIASSDHPECTVEEARQIARGWESTFSEAGNCGRLDVASGHGPWPDGLLRFGVFLKSLDA